MIDAHARATAPAALLAALAGVRILAPGSPGASLVSIAIDSRLVRRGGAFVALRGTRSDGHDFARAAAAAGAGLLVVDERFVAAAGGDAAVVAALGAGGATVAAVPDTRAALARLTAVWFGEPAKVLTIAGVTGTNGKTTTTYLVAAMLEAAGLPCGRIGTLGAAFGASAWPLENTTPLALELQSLFAAMRDRGARAVAMEVSSHALALGRTDDVPFAVGALTNVTRDHLDFHGSFEAYAAAKRSLFERAAVAVLNLDDPCGAAWTPKIARSREVVTYAIDAPEASLRPEALELGRGGSTFTVDGTEVRTSLPGRFNVANVLCALACARALGLDLATAASALETVRAVPGRMEHFSDGEVDVLVDYAHTPDALENVLRAARETARARTIVVFGCGGDRDPGKRAMMGRIASELADVTIVTSDNPRSEDPYAIVAEVLAGAGASAYAEVDRAAAIARAIELARPGDVVVVAGKGHETYQLAGGTTLHFDDREHVRAALAGRASAAGA